MSNNISGQINSHKIYWQTNTNLSNSALHLFTSKLHSLAIFFYAVHVSLVVCLFYFYFFRLNSSMVLYAFRRSILYAQAHERYELSAIAGIMSICRIVLYRRETCRHISDYYFCKKDLFKYQAIDSSRATIQVHTKYFNICLPSRNSTTSNR